MYKADVETLIQTIGENTTLSVNSTFSYIIIGSDKSKYYTGARFSFYIDGNGTAQFQNNSTPPMSSTFPHSVISKIEEYFSTPRKSYAELSVSVKVN